MFLGEVTDVVCAGGKKGDDVLFKCFCGRQKDLEKLISTNVVSL